MIDLALHPFRRRLRLVLALKGAIQGARGGAIILAAAMLARWLQLTPRGAWELPSAIGFAILCVAVGAVAALVRRLPDEILAAVVERRAQLGAGLSTALEMKARGHPFAPALERSAAQALAATTPQKAFPAPALRGLRQLPLALGLALALALLPPLTAPSSVQLLRQRAQLSEAKTAPAEAAARALRDASQRDPETEALARDTRRLAGQLRQGELDFAAALDAVGRLDNDARDVISEARSQRDLRDALSDEERFEQLRSAWRDGAAGLESEATRELLADLESLATGDPELAEAFRRLRQARTPQDELERSDELMRRLERVRQEGPELDERLARAEDLHERILAMRDELVGGPEAPEAAPEPPTPASAAGLEPSDGAPGTGESPVTSGELSETKPAFEGEADTESPPSRAASGAEGGDPAAPQAPGELPGASPEPAGVEPAPGAGTESPSSGSEATGQEPPGAATTKPEDATPEITEPGAEPEAGATSGDPAEPTPPESPVDPPAEPTTSPDAPSAEPTPEVREEPVADESEPQPEPTEEEAGEGGGLLGELAAELAKSMLESGVTPPMDMMEGMAEEGMLQDFARDMAESLIDSGFELPEDFEMPPIPDDIKEQLRNQNPSPEAREWQERIARKLLERGFKPPKTLDMDELRDLAPADAQRARETQGQREIAEQLAKMGFQPPGGSKVKPQAAAGERAAGGEGSTGPAPPSSGPSGDASSGRTEAAGGFHAEGAPKGGARAPSRAGPQSAGASPPRDENGYYAPALERVEDAQGGARWVVTGGSEGTGAAGSMAGPASGGSATRGGARAPAAAAAPSSGAVEVVYDPVTGSVRGVESLPPRYRRFVKRYFERPVKEEDRRD